ncbi:MAG: hypothetical protein ABI613_02370 [Gemmatimonadota bacterium]
MVIGPGWGVLLLVMLIGGLTGGEMLARQLPGMGWARGRAVVRRAMLGGVVVYATLLLTVSLTSQEEMLGQGVPKRFCGFYLDCHLGVAVQGVERATTIGAAHAAGSFYIVTIRVSSNAKRATLMMKDPRVVVLDARGNRFERATTAEAELGKVSSPPAPFAQPVIAGASFDTRVVFDLPNEVRAPRLLIRDVRGVDVVIESLLTGDEDSMLHKPTTFKL